MNAQFTINISSDVFVLYVVLIAFLSQFKRKYDIWPPKHHEESQYIKPEHQYYTSAGRTGIRRKCKKTQKQPYNNSTTFSCSLSSVVFAALHLSLSLFVFY